MQALRRITYVLHKRKSDVRVQKMASDSIYLTDVMHQILAALKGTNQYHCGLNRADPENNTVTPESSVYLIDGMHGQAPGHTVYAWGRLSSCP